MIEKYIYNLYKCENRLLRRALIKYITSIEGGEYYSKTLRKIFEDYHGISVGMYSYGGCFSIESVQPGIQIGRYCSFAKNIYVLAGNHPVKFKSLHPFFYNPALGHVNDLLINRTKCVIENDVWVGQGAIILPSVKKIENGAIIGAGSVVTKNVPPFAIVAGNPAKIIGHRFNQVVIDEIIESRWWDYDINIIKEKHDLFMSFLKNID